MSRVRVYLPALLLLVFLLALVLASTALAAPSNPSDPGKVTTGACAFSTTWFDGISRWIFGLSLVLFLVAAVLGIRNLHTEGPWGGIVAIAGVGVLLSLVAQLPNLAPIALAAAGAPSC